MKKKIAIVAGGDSSEYAVSLRSAQGVWSFLDHDKYDTYMILVRGKDWRMVGYDDGQYRQDKAWPIDRNDFSVTTGAGKLTFDFAYIIIHGTPGENGLMQGYFDLIGMPYSCCGVLAAALTCSKYFCNRYLSTLGIDVAPSILVHKGESIDTARVVGELGLPVFVKPNAGGSSYATTKVKTADQLQPAIAAAMAEATGDVLIERFMAGQEITCGCYTSRDGLRALPITEVCPKREFFDVDAKYNGAVEEITPARISAELTERVQQLTQTIYRYLGAKGIIRVDYIIIDGVPHLLEVNTTPGMTATSFIPQEVRAAGLDIKDVMDDVIGASMPNA